MRTPESGTLQEVERRICDGVGADIEAFARGLVAAAWCEDSWHDSGEREPCPTCQGTGVSPARLEAAYRAMEV